MTQGDQLLDLDISFYSADSKTEYEKLVGESGPTRSGREKDRPDR